jgi:hypothetical protein
MHVSLVYKSQGAPCPMQLSIEISDSDLAPE